MKKLISIMLLASIGNASNVCLLYLQNTSIKMQEMNEYFEVDMYSDGCSSANLALYYAVKANVLCNDDKSKTTIREAIKVLNKINKRCNE